MIKFFDLTKQYNKIGKEIEDGVKSVLSSGRYVGGEQVEKFEENFARYVGTEYCVSCANGTDALMLALKSISKDVNAGEIITVPNTYVATVEAIIHAGFMPKFVDIDARTGLMNLDLLEKSITKDTVGIIPVHLYGQVVDIEKLCNIADSSDTYIIEDACQAHGATFKGHKAGSMGDIGCFSFYPSKNLGCAGDGGAITLNDEYLYHRILALRDHGQTGKNVHNYIGHNSRLDAIQACVLNIKLKYLDGWNDDRRKIAWIYDRGLNMLDARYDREIEPHLEFLEYDPNTNPVFHLYVIKAHDRQKIMRRLEKGDVQYGIHYPTPIHKMPAYRIGCENENYPEAEKFCNQIISLPMYPEMSLSEVNLLCNAIKGVI